MWAKQKGNCERGSKSILITLNMIHQDIRLYRNTL